jgi:hypothetical protein
VLGPPHLPTGVPSTIAAPEGVTLIDWYDAVGTQNYVCTAMTGQGGGAGTTYAWVFVAPKADLFDRCGAKVGSHFAAPNTSPPAPEWQYDADGSSVTGAKVASSPVPNAIPELRLEATGHSGTGLFSSVTNVQRLHTAGGVAPPAADCDADHVDQEQDVNYSAEYYFYSGSPDGGTQ